MTNIKGAIEVYIIDRGHIITCKPVEANGLAISHDDLEAYVQERERKAFEAGRRMRGWPSLEFYYSEFEDFKKLTTGKNVNEEQGE